MQTILLKSLNFQKKSKVKAGDGLLRGEYKFFTSSENQTKYLDSFDLEGPALIFGTGGKASVHYCDEKFSTSTDCFVLKTDREDIYLKYVYYYLFGNIYLLEQGFKGAGLKHISKTYLGELEIPLPPLPTQKQIVQKLDAISNLINLQTKKIQKQKDLTKSIFLEMFGDPMLNEKGWEVKKVGEVAEIISGSTPKTKEPGFWDGNIKWITPAEINSNDFYIYDTDRKITEAGRASVSLKVMPVGTVIFSSRAPIGKVAIAGVEMCCNQGFKNMICGESINNIFLYFLLKLSTDNLIFKGRGATFKELSKKIIEDYDIYLPPLPLQQKFAKIVMQNEYILSLEREKLSKLEELYNSEMQESFRSSP